MLAIPFENEKKESKSDIAPVGIVIPPGCDNPLFHNCGETVSTYTPPSYRPYTSPPEAARLPQTAPEKKMKRACPYKEPLSSPQRSMTEYLSQFLGSTLCLSLHFGQQRRCKKCGLLLEVGKDFLVLKDSRSKGVSVLDLKPVLYIEISSCQSLLFQEPMV